MNNNSIIKLLESVLGPSKISSKGEVIFECPLKQHRTSKLSVNINTGKYHCWACTNMRGKSLFSLLKKINASKETFEKLSKLVKNTTFTNTFVIPKKSRVELPREYIHLSKKSNNPEYKNAYFYTTKKRGITIEQINTYNIGYCPSGEYAHRVIVPSYDDNGVLNFFVARSYYSNTKRYLNPVVEKNAIVPFELYTSWMFPVIFVEGMFDAIAVNRNAIPLLGNTISDVLILKLLQNDTPLVYLALDGGEGSRFVYNNLKKLIDFGIPTKIINLPDNKDASDLGTKNFWKIFETNTININLKTLIKYKRLRK